MKTQILNPYEDFADVEAIDERMEQVRQRAYELFEQRGGEHGHAVEDWLRAEREIFGAGTKEPAALRAAA